MDHMPQVCTRYLLDGIVGTVKNLRRSYDVRGSWGHFGSSLVLSKSLGPTVK